MNQSIKAQLIASAAAKVSEYSQYQGHFDDYVLVQIPKVVKSRFSGLSFNAGEMAIAKPVVYNFTTTRGRKAQSVVVWSNLNKIDTHVDIKSIRFLENVELKQGQNL